MANDTDPVLLGTSVWIDALRGRTAAVVARVRRLLNDDRAVTCGPVIYEIHRGLRLLASGSAHSHLGYSDRPCFHGPAEAPVATWTILISSAKPS